VLRRAFEHLGIASSRCRRHDDVEQDHVRLVQTRAADRVVARCRLVLDLDVVLGLEQRAEARAHDAVVVDDEHADGHSDGTSATIVVPAPRRDSISTRPRAAPTRSRIPSKPIPSPLRLGSKPTPSSSTITADRPAPLEHDADVSPAACLTMFVSDSCTIR
jgi:hypothetical protein